MSKKVFTLEELAHFTNSTLVGNPQHQISDVADLESAGAEDASFLANPNYEQAMRRSAAGVVFITQNIAPIEGRNFLINENPSRAFQQTLEACYGNVQEFTGFDAIHPTAIIHETASLGSNVQIGPYAVIDKNVKIGNGTAIGAHCYVGPSTTIGNDCLIHPQVTIRERTQIGNRVILQPGAVIGSCGFGYIQDKSGRSTKLNQIGYVHIDDDVEIGANSTIDRSRFKATKIGRGTKIDNLVQIGHGVIIGEDSIIIAQTGIAGSTKIGNRVILAGQVAVAGHISITDGVMIAGKSGVSKSVDKPGKYGGIPAVPLSEYNRNSVFLRNIESCFTRIKEIENQINQLADTQQK